MPGAGRPKGSLNKTTLERSAIKQRIIDRIHHKADTLLNAQLSKALGETYLMRQVTKNVGRANERRTTEIVTDPEIIRQFIDEELDIDQDTEYYYMTTKPADNQALQGLMDRAFGKADAKVENTGEQTLTIVTRHAGSKEASTTDDN